MCKSFNLRMSSCHVNLVMTCHQSIKDSWGWCQPATLPQSCPHIAGNMHNLSSLYHVSVMPMIFTKYDMTCGLKGVVSVVSEMLTCLSNGLRGQSSLGMSGFNNRRSCVVVCRRRARTTSVCAHTTRKETPTLMRLSGWMASGSSRKAGFTENISIQCAPYIAAMACRLSPFWIQI